MQKLNDLSRSLTVLKGDSTLLAVIEMSQSSWLIAGIVPGVERFAAAASDRDKARTSWRCCDSFRATAAQSRIADHPTCRSTSSLRPGPGLHGG